MFLSYKSTLFHTLLFTTFSLCLDLEFSHKEILKLMDRFNKNGYPSNFIDIFYSNALR